MSAPIYTGGRPFIKGGLRFKNFIVFNKTVTAILDDVATTIFTINVPNPPTGQFVASNICVSLLTVLGAGGAVAAGETVTSAEFSVVVARTPGAAAVIAITAAVFANSVSVAGGDASVAAVLTNVAVAGANTVAQTFAMQTTIDDDTGSATNDICVVNIYCMNAGLGVTFTA
jgi:hypothetical protein